MEETPTPKRGRPSKPAATRYLAARSIRFTQQDLDDLAELAALWRTKDAEALRRAIRETLSREKRRARE